MKTGIFIAVVLHVAFILFGGLIFNTPKRALGDILELSPSDLIVEPKQVPIFPAVKAPKEDNPIPSEVPPSFPGGPRGPQPNGVPPDSIIIDPINSGNGDKSFGIAGWPEHIEFGPNGGEPGAMGGPGIRIDPNTIERKPRVLMQTQPIFPAEMRGKAVDGVVVVIFVVDADGKVINQCVESTSHPAFEKPALDAVKQWKFEPAMRGHNRVDNRMRATLRFQGS